MRAAAGTPRLTARRRAVAGRLRALRPAEPALIVGAIAVAAFAFAVRYVDDLNGWFVMTDELLYAKLGLSAGDGLSYPLEVRDEPYYLYSVLYPLLIAPALAAFDMATAFEAVHVVNAALMASTAVPAFLLARAAALPRSASYLVAALSVAVPWLAMSAIVWTEVAGYPAFAWALWGMQRSLSHPGPRTDLLALGGIALAFLARTQFVVLVAILPLAVLAHELGWRLATRDRDEHRGGLWTAARSLAARHRVLLAGYGLIAVGALVLAAGSGVRTILGTYSTTSYGDLLPEGTLAASWQHLAVFGVALGVVPVVAGAGWALVALARPAGRERHALAVLLVAVLPLLVLQASSFTLRFSGGFQDRYVFYLAPLVFAAMAACLLDGRRSAPGVLAAGAAFALIADAVTYEPASAQPIFASPPSVFWAVLDGKSYDLGRLLSIDDLSPVTVMEVASVASAALLAGALARVRSGMALLLIVGLATLAFELAETRYVMARVPERTTPVSGQPLTERDWVDGRVGSSALVGLVPNPDPAFPSQAGSWDVEMFNKSIRRSYSFEGGATHTPFDAETLELDRRSGLLHASDSSPGHLVLWSTDFRFRPQGRLIGDEHLGFLLYEPERPWRADWASSRLDELGRLPERRARLRFYPAAGERARAVRVRLILHSPEQIDPREDPALQRRRPYTIRFPGGERSGRVPAGELRKLSLSFCVPASAVRDVTLRVDGNGTETTPEGDERVFGLAVAGVSTTSEPLRGPDCPDPG